MEHCTIGDDEVVIYIFQTLPPGILLSPSTVKSSCCCIPEMPSLLSFLRNFRFDLTPCQCAASSRVGRKGGSPGEYGNQVQHSDFRIFTVNLHFTTVKKLALS